MATTPASSISIRVELPTYSHSFVVTVNDSDECTVSDIKQAISRACIGEPSVEGQRLIWRGRYLNNEEKVAELWPQVKAEAAGDEQPRVVHLSVHPSAWKSAPPSTTTDHEKGKGKQRDTSLSMEEDVLQKLTAAAPLLTPTPTTKSTPTSAPARPVYPSQSSTVPPPPQPTHAQCTAYILSKHRQALSLLTNDPVVTRATVVGNPDREDAVRFVNAHGYIWPSILDEEFPGEHSEKGLVYERAVIDGRPYLRLVSPPATQPTPAQTHAISVLSYTLALLKLSPLTPAQLQQSQSRAQSPSSQTSSSANSTAIPPVEVPAHLNAILQQLGLPPIQALPAPPMPVFQHREAGVYRAQQPANFADLPNLVNGNANGANGNMNGNAANPPPLPIRPLLVPIFMLTLRTLLLLYFVAPARKPVLGILILCWVIWEVWVPVREVFGRGLGAIERLAAEEENVRMGNQQNNVANGNQPNGNANQNQNQNLNPPPNVNAPGAPPANAAARDVNGNAAAPVPPPVNAPAAPAAGANATAGIGLLDTLASFDIPEGEAALGSFSDLPDVGAGGAGGANANLNAGGQGEPSLARKGLSFIVLMLTTVHPAVWNRRRALLRTREGRVRVEMGVLSEGANAAGLEGGQGEAAEREGQDGEGEQDTVNATALENARRAERRAEVLAKYMRRPLWVRRYMQRVVRGEWVDDSD